MRLVWEGIRPKLPQECVVVSLKFYWVGSSWGCMTTEGVRLLDFGG